jgi:HK97 family phage major capsid protein
LPVLLAAASAYSKEKKMPFATEAEFKTGCERLTAANGAVLELTKLTTGDEPREWTEDEQAQAEALHDECVTLEKEVEDHKARREAGQKIRQDAAARQTKLETTSRGRQTTPAQIESTGSESVIGGDGACQLTHRELSLVKRSGNLLSFSGPNASYDAYASGQWWLSHLAAPGSGMRAEAVKWCQDHPDQLAQSVIDNSKGGVLVPSSFESAVIDLRDKYGVARREFFVKPMVSDSDTQPRRVSGPTAYYMGDNATITESDMAWDQVELTARKIGCYSLISAELNEDAVISIADTLAREFAEAFAKSEDQAGFLGDGSATYCKILGLITQCTAATASTVTALTANTAFSSLDLVDFESMIGKLPDYAEEGAKWYISKAGFAASMMRLVDAAGGNTAEMLAGKVRRYFLGYEVVTVSVMNSTLGAQTSVKGICYLGNLRLAATLGNRREMRTIVSREGEKLMKRDQIGIQGTQRFAMNVHDVGDTSIPGPVIMLAMPGS